MIKKLSILLISLLILGGSFMAYPVVKQAGPELSQRIEQSKQFKEGFFYNAAPVNPGANVWASLKKVLFEKPEFATPKESIPFKAISKAQLQKPHYAIYRLGHSSILIKLGQETWLLDPVFAERASPYSFMGPKRFHSMPLGIAELPAITGVIISHDHYDHLDKQAIQSLAGKTSNFIVPLGVGDHLKKWGIPSDSIHELDWWQDISVADSKLVATPAQHFSGRGLRDRNKTLWSSWVIQHQDLKIFFSGDSGYFDGFKEIGERLGPFNYTLMETGAYDENWPDIHMLPEQSMQAHLDLKGQHLIPIHNGTFDLAAHNWFEPLERIAQAAEKLQVSLLTPIMGESINLVSPDKTDFWWRQTNDAQNTD